MNSLVQRSFAAGELAPVLHSRADLAKYAAGLKTCHNFFVRREGGASNRAGMRFVEYCKTDTYGTRLARFVGSTTDESFLLEMGAGYIRFYQQGAAVEVESAPAYDGGTTYLPGDIVTSGGTHYYCIVESTGNAPPNASFWYALTGALLEVPTPYTLDSLPLWNQSGNVLTLTHPGVAPMELIYEGGYRWVLREVDTSIEVAAPTNVAGTAAGVGTRTFKYIVTAAALGTYEESVGSAVATVANTIEPDVDNPIPLTWDANATIEEWYVYCDPHENGVFGYVGTAAQNSFQHAGQVPDFNLTPPIERVLFDAANEYPTCSANYQQRRFFANTFDEPDSIYGSRIGFPSNFGISSPLQDDDSVTFRLAGNNHHPIRHMVAIAAGLVLFTDGGEWTVTGAGGRKNPITPSSLDAEQETYVGVLPWARPVVVGSSVLYVQARGNVMRELRFDQEVEGLAGKDLTIFATHLFERKQIYFVDFQQTPHSIIWCCDDEGRLLGLTYIPDQDVWGWHRHTTDGLVEDVCVVPEEDEDTLYLIVRRTRFGVSRRYIEKLERREIDDAAIHATSFFVDSGLSYSGAPADQFAGLDHLEGRTVAVYADGQALFDGYSSDSPVVSGGTVTLAAEYTNVHIGLPYTATLETLDLDVQGSEIRDKKKRINGVTLLVERSARGFEAGSDLADMREYTPQAWESTADLNDDQLELPIAAEYNRAGRVIVRQTKPLPITVLGIIPRAELGG